MDTEIMFVSGEALTFDEQAEIKMTPLGVEITEKEGDDVIRILFPWAQVGRITQRGPQVSAIYHY